MQSQYVLVDQLSEREIDVLKELRCGHSNRRIAALLHISIYTVEHHLTSMYAKLGVNSRIKAVLEAQRRKILPPE